MMEEKIDPSKNKPSGKRPVDLLADEVAPWWKKNFVYIGKGKIVTWKGTLILMFVAGVAAALIWSAKNDFYFSSHASAASTLSFNEGTTVSVTNGATLTLTPKINTGTNYVSIVSLHIAFDQTKLALDSITPSSTFGTIEAAASISNTNGTATEDLSVGNANPSVNGTFSVATLTFHAIATGSASVAFTGSGAAADGETGNVVTSTTPTTVTVTAADSTPPSGGSATYTNGYFTTASVALTVADGTDSGTGINTSSRIVQRKSATLSAGSCGTYGTFATISPTGTYPNLTDTTVASGNCYQYQYLVSDNAPTPNQATYTSTNTAKVDTAAPTGGSISYTDGYFTTASVTATATDGTDAVSGISTSTRTFQRRSATLSSGTCGSYGSWGNIGSTGNQSLTDTTVASGNCYQYQYLVSDNAGKQATYTTSNVVKVDTAAPTGGSISYTDGYNNTHSIVFTANDGSDSISGINSLSRILQRRSATISAGACGSYSSWSTVTMTGTYPSLTNTTLAAGNCYQYQYLVSDNAGKQATYTSANTVKATYSSDINLDGKADYLDYGVLHTNYGNTTCGNVADINNDGNCLVDYLDYGILHSEYGGSLL
jgi:hypothetical protein